MELFRRINPLILTINLQWAGFEVGAAKEEVVRFWYSVLRALRNLCIQHTFGAFPLHGTAQYRH